MAAIFTNNAFLYRIAEMISDANMNLEDSIGALNKEYNSQTGTSVKASCDPEEIFSRVSRTTRITTRLLESCEEELLAISRIEAITDEQHRLNALAKTLDPITTDMLIRQGEQLLESQREAGRADAPPNRGAINAGDMGPGSIAMNKGAVTAIETNLMNISLALNGVSMLLEEISNSTQDKAHEISWSRSIVEMITSQVEQTEDVFREASKGCGGHGENESLHA